MEAQDKGHSLDGEILKKKGRKGKDKSGRINLFLSPLQIQAPFIIIIIIFLIIQAPFSNILT